MRRFRGGTRSTFSSAELGLGHEKGQEQTHKYETVSTGKSRGSKEEAVCGKRQAGIRNLSSHKGSEWGGRGGRRGTNEGEEVQLEGPASSRIEILRRALERQFGDRRNDSLWSKEKTLRGSARSRRRQAGTPFGWTHLVSIELDDRVLLLVVLWNDGLDDLTVGGVVVQDELDVCLNGRLEAGSAQALRLRL